MVKVKKQKRSSRLALFWGLVGAAGFALLINRLLANNNIALFNPKGLVAQQQMDLMVISVGVLLLAVVPSLFLFYFFAWKYRESNDQATYDPGHRPKKFDWVAWGVPTAFMLVLALVMWPATHQLEPQKHIAAAGTKPLTVEVVALRWKWLFIYPDQNIATVNFLKLPVNTPVEFDITADDMPMSSFWIPNLGGMLYSMTGHVNRLNLMPTVMGDYEGSSAEINGGGFADMKFVTRVSSQADFDAWVQGIRMSPSALSDTTYQALLKPTDNNPAAYYASVDRGLYNKVLMKYADGMGGMSMEGHTH